MATSATILIPDISGFTEFMTKTEVVHGSTAIGALLDNIIQTTGEEYEISEIEGDAVLMFKKGSAPSKKQLIDTCMKIYNAFHYQIKWMHQHTICPCNTCKELNHLTLKFVAHHGIIDEMKIGRFTTLSGTDVIIAHRLMKNSVPSDEYLLITENLYMQAPDSDENFDLEWGELSDEFSSIGKINYRFAKLEEARLRTPNPPIPETVYKTDKSPFLETAISAHFRDIYMVVMNIPERNNWFSDLLKVEQEVPQVFLGSVHQCFFEEFQATLSPVKLEINDDWILYAESCKIPEMNISLIYEYIFRKKDERNSIFTCRFINTDFSHLPEHINSILLSQLKLFSNDLKGYCEKMEFSFF